MAGSRLARSHCVWTSKIRVPLAPLVGKLGLGLAELVVGSSRT